MGGNARESDVGGGEEEVKGAEQQTKSKPKRDVEDESVPLK